MKPAANGREPAVAGGRGCRHRLAYDRPFDRDVFVLHGTTLIDIGALADTATSAELVALARRVDAQLG